MGYTIRYHTGAGDKEVEGDLRDAMKEADKGIAYTQQPVTIEDERGDLVARRDWSGSLAYIEDYEDPIPFGKFGYYTDWQEVHEP
jgi:hypothetical protein